MYRSLLLTIGVFISFLISDQLFAQSTVGDDWLTTEATITKVKDEGMRKRDMWADVTYKAEDGKSYNSSIKLFTIPFLGTFKKAGDKINVSYDPSNPIIAKSQTSHFMDSNWMFILIAVGVFFSFFRLKSMFGSKNKT